MSPEFGFHDSLPESTNLYHRVHLLWRAKHLKVNTQPNAHVEILHLSFEKVAT